MSTVSEVFGRRSGGGMPHDTAPADLDSAADAQARGRARIPVALRDGKIVAWLTGFGSTAAADLHEAWWTPASLPTVQKAWANRMPDRDRVPGGWAPLYYGWVAYNHAVALPLTVLALIGVGALSMFTWAAIHPARLILAAVIAVATIALILG